MPGNVGEIDVLKHEGPQLVHRLTGRLALHDVTGASRLLDDVPSKDVDPRRAGLADHIDGAPRQILLVESTGTNRVVDVVVDVRHAIDDPHDPSLERSRCRRAARVAHDAVADIFGQVETATVALEQIDDPQRMLVVPEIAAKPLLQTSVERVLTDVTERLMTDIKIGRAHV